MESEDGQLFIKRIVHFVRTHEKALANALQAQQRRQPVRRGSDIPGSPRTPVGTAREPSSGSAASSLASALTLPFTSQSLKPAQLALTPHHLYYLLSRFEELNIAVGPMGVRLENIHAEASPANYVSFLRDSSTRRNRSSDSLSIHSVSSVRSVMSGMSSIWSNFGFGPSVAARNEKAKAALGADLKYLYSSFTKVPCLKLAPDRKARLVEGFEEFPFDTAVPLLAFKNVSALEICDIDIRQFFGWDRMAEQLNSLVVKRAGIEDPAELLISIVLDDTDRRRRRSAKTQSSPIGQSPADAGTPSSAPPSPSSGPPSRSAVAGAHAASAPAGHYHNMSRAPSESSRSSSKNRPRSSSPCKSSSRPTSQRMRRSGSGSSHSSAASTVLPSPVSLPANKWRMLRHLSLSDNGLHSITTAALVPLAGSLTSLDLSNNLFAAVPESLSILSNLRLLNLAGNMINSLHSLTRSPLPAITSLNLRANRLSSIAGIERALTLERLDLRQNGLTDPTELARLTSAPNFTAVWVAANPFTKTHPSYRITIFNLFRSTPGYTDDVLLDSQGPGMMEKRSLVERAAEAPSVPVVRVPKQQPVTVHQVMPLDSNKKKDNRTDEKPIPTAEVARAKRKTGRRRVVELNREDSNNNLSGSGADAQPVRTLVRSPTNPARTQPLSNKKQQQQQQHRIDIEATALEDASSGAESSPPPSLPNDHVDWSIRGDEYRRKVEALKNEVGSGWLSVLSEEGLSLASTRKASPSAPAR